MAHGCPHGLFVGLDWNNMTKEEKDKVWEIVNREKKERREKNDDLQKNAQ